MIRYAVFAKDNNGVWNNVYKDERTYKNKKYAVGRMEAFCQFRNYEARIEEIEVLDEKDQEITRLKKALEIADKIVLLATHIRDEEEADIVEGCAREAQKQIKEILNNKSIS